MKFSTLGCVVIATLITIVASVAYHPSDFRNLQGASGMGRFLAGGNFRVGWVPPARLANVTAADFGFLATRAVVLVATPTWALVMGPSTAAQSQMEYAAVYKPDGSVAPVVAVRLAPTSEGLYKIALVRLHAVEVVEPGHVIVGNHSEAGMTNGNASAARFWDPQDILYVQNAPVVLVADTGNNCVREVHVSDPLKSETVTTFRTLMACDATTQSTGRLDGDLVSARLWKPVALAGYPRRLFVAERDGAIRLISGFNNRVTTVAEAASFALRAPAVMNRVFLMVDPHNILLLHVILGDTLFIRNTFSGDTAAVANVSVQGTTLATHKVVGYGVMEVQGAANLQAVVVQTSVANVGESQNTTLATLCCAEASITREYRAMDISEQSTAAITPIFGGGTGSGFYFAAPARTRASITEPQLLYAVDREIGQVFAQTIDTLGRAPIHHYNVTSPNTLVIDEPAGYVYISANCALFRATFPTMAMVNLIAGTPGFCAAPSTAPIALLDATLGTIDGMVMRTSRKSIVAADRDQCALRELDLENNVASVILGTNCSEWVEGPPTGLGLVRDVALVNDESLIFFTAVHPFSGAFLLRKSNWATVTTVVSDTTLPFSAILFTVDPGSDGSIVIGLHPERNVLQAVNTTTGLVQLIAGTYFSPTVSRDDPAVTGVIPSGVGGVSVDPRNGAIFVGSNTLVTQKVAARAHAFTVCCLRPKLMNPVAAVNEAFVDGDPRAPFPSAIRVADGPKLSAVSRTSTVFVCDGYSVRGETLSTWKLQEHMISTVALSGSGTFPGDCTGITLHRELLLISSPTTGCIHSTNLTGNMYDVLDKFAAVGGAVWRRTSPTAACLFHGQIAPHNDTHVLATSTARNCLRLVLIVDYITTMNPTWSSVSDAVGNCSVTSSTFVGGLLDSARLTTVFSIAPSADPAKVVYLALRGNLLARVNFMARAVTSISDLGAPPTSTDPWFIAPDIGSSAEALLITRGTVVEWYDPNTGELRIVTGWRRRSSPTYSASATPLIVPTAEFVFPPVASSTMNVACAFHDGSFLFTVTDSSSVRFKLIFQAGANFVSQPFHRFGASLGWNLYQPPPTTTGFPAPVVKILQRVAFDDQFAMLANGQIWGFSASGDNTFGGLTLWYDVMVNGSVAGLQRDGPWDMALFSNATSLLIRNGDCIWTLNMSFNLALGARSTTPPDYDTAPALKSQICLGLNLHVGRIATASRSDSAFIPYGGGILLAEFAPTSAARFAGSFETIRAPVDGHRSQAHLGAVLSVIFADDQDLVMYATTRWESSFFVAKIVANTVTIVRLPPSLVFFNPKFECRNLLIPSALYIVDNTTLGIFDTRTDTLATVYGNASDASVRPSYPSTARFANLTTASFSVRQARLILALGTTLGFIYGYTADPPSGIPSTMDVKWQVVAELTDARLSQAIVMSPFDPRVIITGFPPVANASALQEVLLPTLPLVNNATWSPPLLMRSQVGFSVGSSRVLVYNNVTRLLYAPSNASLFAVDPVTAEVTRLIGAHGSTMAPGRLRHSGHVSTLLTRPASLMIFEMHDDLIGILDNSCVIVVLNLTSLNAVRLAGVATECSIADGELGVARFHVVASARYYRRTHAIYASDSFIRKLDLGRQWVSTVERTPDVSWAVTRIDDETDELWLAYTSHRLNRAGRLSISIETLETTGTAFNSTGARSIDHLRIGTISVIRVASGVVLTGGSQTLVAMTRADVTMPLTLPPPAFDVYGGVRSGDSLHAVFIDNQQGAQSGNKGDPVTQDGWGSQLVLPTTRNETLLIARGPFVITFRKRRWDQWSASETNFAIASNSSWQTTAAIVGLASFEGTALSDTVFATLQGVNQLFAFNLSTGHTLGAAGALLGLVLRTPSHLLLAGCDRFLFIADTGNSCIRQLADPAEFAVRNPDQAAARQKFRTVAGVCGSRTFQNVDGESLNATFHTPFAITINRDMSLMYVLDIGSRRVRRVDLLNRRTTTVMSGGLLAPRGIALDFSTGEQSPSIFITDAGNRVIHFNTVSRRLTLVAGDVAFDPESGQAAPNFNMWDNVDRRSVVLSGAAAIAVERSNGTLFFGDSRSIWTYCCVEGAAPSTQGTYDPALLTQQWNMTTLQGPGAPVRDIFRPNNRFALPLLRVKLALSGAGNRFRSGFVVARPLPSGHAMLHLHDARSGDLVRSWRPAPIMSLTAMIAVPMRVMSDTANDALTDGIIVASDWSSRCFRGFTSDWEGLVTITNQNCVDRSDALPAERVVFAPAGVVLSATHGLIYADEEECCVRSFPLMSSASSAASLSQISSFSTIVGTCGSIDLSFPPRWGGSAMTTSIAAPWGLALVGSFLYVTFAENKDYVMRIDLDGARHVVLDLGRFRMNGQLAVAANPLADTHSDDSHQLWIMGNERDGMMSATIDADYRAPELELVDVSPRQVLGWPGTPTPIAESSEQTVCADGADPRDIAGGFLGVAYDATSEALLFAAADGRLRHLCCVAPMMTLPGAYVYLETRFNSMSMSGEAPVYYNGARGLIYTFGNSVRYMASGGWSFGEHLFSTPHAAHDIESIAIVGASASMMAVTLELSDCVMWFNSVDRLSGGFLDIVGNCTPSSNARGLVDGPPGVARARGARSIVAITPSQLLFADEGNHCIRRIDIPTPFGVYFPSDGFSTTSFAGRCGFPGSADGQLLNASFASVWALVVLDVTRGIVIVYERYPSRLRRIDGNVVTTLVQVPPICAESGTLAAHPVLTDILLVTRSAAIDGRSGLVLCDVSGSGRVLSGYTLPREQDASFGWNLTLSAPAMVFAHSSHPSYFSIDVRPGSVMVAAKTSPNDGQSGTYQNIMYFRWLYNDTINDPPRPASAYANVTTATIAFPNTSFVADEITYLSPSVMWYCNLTGEVFMHQNDVIAINAATGAMRNLSETMSLPRRLWRESFIVPNPLNCTEYLRASWSTSTQRFLSAERIDGTVLWQLELIVDYDLFARVGEVATTTDERALIFSSQAYGFAPAPTLRRLLAPCGRCIVEILPFSQQVTRFAGSADCGDVSAYIESFSDGWRRQKQFGQSTGMPLATVCSANSITASHDGRVVYFVDIIERTDSERYFRRATEEFIVTLDDAGARSWNIMAHPSDPDSLLVSTFSNQLLITNATVGGKFLSAIGNGSQPSGELPTDGSGPIVTSFPVSFTRPARDGSILALEYFTTPRDTWFVRRHCCFAPAPPPSENSPQSESIPNVTAVPDVTAGPDGSIPIAHFRPDTAVNFSLMSVAPLQNDRAIYVIVASRIRATFACTRLAFTGVASTFSPMPLPRFDGVPAGIAFRHTSNELVVTTSVHTVVFIPLRETASANALTNVSSQVALCGTPRVAGFGHAAANCTAALFHSPTFVVVDPAQAAGAIVSDSTNACVRLIVDGMVTKLVGMCGTAGFRDGFGDVALLGRAPAGLALVRRRSDFSLLVFICDASNFAVRVFHRSTRFLVTVVRFSAEDASAPIPWQVAAFDESQLLVLDSSPAFRHKRRLVGVNVSYFSGRGSAAIENTTVASVWNLGRQDQLPAVVALLIGNGTAALLAINNSARAVVATKAVMLAFSHTPTDTPSHSFSAARSQTPSVTVSGLHTPTTSPSLPTSRSPEVTRTRTHSTTLTDRVPCVAPTLVVDPAAIDATEFSNGGTVTLSVSTTAGATNRFADDVAQVTLELDDGIVEVVSIATNHSVSRSAVILQVRKGRNSASAVTSERGGTLALRFSNASFTCPPEDRTAIAQVTATAKEASVVPQEVKKTVQGLTVATGAISGVISSPTLVMYQARASVALQLSVCKFSHVEALESTQSLTSMHFGPESGSYYRGGVVGQWLIVFGGAVLGSVLSFVHFLIVKPPSLADSFDKMRMPGVIAVPFLVVLQGIVMTTTATVMHNFEPAADIPLGMASLVGIAAAASIVYLQTGPWFKLHQVDMRAEYESANVETHLLKSRLTMFLIGSLRWEDDDPEGRFKKRWGQLCADYRSGAQWYLCVEIVFSFFTGVIEGLRPSESATCIGSIAAALLLNLVGLGVLLRVHPFASQFNSWHAVGTVALTAVSTAFLLAAQWYSSGYLLELGELTSTVVIFVGSLKGLLDIVLWLQKLRMKLEFRKWRESVQKRLAAGGLMLSQRLLGGGGGGGGASGSGSASQDGGDAAENTNSRGVLIAPASQADLDAELDALLLSEEDDTSNAIAVRSREEEAERLRALTAGDHHHQHGRLKKLRMTDDDEDAMGLLNALLHAASTTAAAAAGSRPQDPHITTTARSNVLASLSAVERPVPPNSFDDLAAEAQGEQPGEDDALEGTEVAIDADEI